MQLLNLSNMNDSQSFPTPPRLTRSYKALCANCHQRVAIVSNPERVGTCWTCQDYIKFSDLIKKWYRFEMKRKRHYRRKYTHLVLLRKINFDIQSGLYVNVNKFI